MKPIIFSLMLLFLAGCGANENAEQDEAIVAEPPVEEAEALPSWNEGPRRRIISWVQEVSDSASAGFVPEADRIAVFDNDGTLWPEQPYPNQLAFAMHYIKKHADEHPEWKEKPVVKALLADDMEGMMASGKEGLLEVVTLSHSNMTTEQYDQAVQDWLNETTHPKFNRPYDQAIYQPMLEVLKFLRENGFKTFIVSGGGTDFMRVWTEEAYDIPPYQVVGSYNAFEFTNEDGKAQITKLPENVLFDDKEAKPAAIRTFIGKQPIACFGNSDGDLAMMQYTAANDPSLCVIIHHTDSVREYAYDLKTLSGHLEEALTEARERNWLVVDMKNDWKQVFPSQ